MCFVAPSDSLHEKRGSHCHDERTTTKEEEPHHHPRGFFDVALAKGMNDTRTLKLLHLNLVVCGQNSPFWETNCRHSEKLNLSN